MALRLDQQQQSNKKTIKSLLLKSHPKN